MNFQVAPDRPEHISMFASGGVRNNGDVSANARPTQDLPDKKPGYRRALDHGNNMGRWHIERAFGLDAFQQQIGKVRPELTYLIDLLPSLAYSSSRNRNVWANRNNMAAVDLHTKFVHLSTNKLRHAINAVIWTPEGRRLVVAAHSGEFTLWNGMTFNFESIMQAHELPILSLCYSHNDDWLISGDQLGVMKFWQSNFNNVNIINAHTNGVRDIAFSPNDSKFLTAGDDSTVKIWNFNNGKEERTLAGHHWEVKTADWHPSLGLIVSGSKDNLVKFWDPRSPSCVTTLHGFKHTVNRCRFQTSGTRRLLASVSRDRSCRVFDIRTMKDIFVLRDHDTDLSCVAWNPVHPSLLTTAAYNGQINHYMLDTSIGDTSGLKRLGQLAPSIEPAHTIPFAHERAVHALEFHPMGHILCSAGTDKLARFWSRARPNDPMAAKEPVYTDDKQGAWYYSVNNHANAVIPVPENAAGHSQFSPTKPATLPGMTQPPIPLTLPGLHRQPDVPAAMPPMPDTTNQIPGLSRQ